MENILEKPINPESKRLFLLARGTIPNSIEVRFDNGGYATLKADGDLYPILNVFDESWITKAIKTGIMAEVSVGSLKDRLYFPNYANSTVIKILNSPVNFEIEIPSLEESKVETDSIISVKTKLNESFMVDDSVNDVQLKIECPKYRSHTLIQNGKFEIVIDESEEENREEITKYFEQQVLLYTEMGVICEVPYFSVEKEVYKMPFGNVSFTSYNAQFPNFKTHTSEQLQNFPKSQLVVNLRHPLVRKSIL